MLDINNIKIGDPIIAIDVSYTSLIENKRYIISEICNQKRYSTNELIWFVNVVGYPDKYFADRFNSDLKELRTQKLKQILNNA